MKEALFSKNNYTYIGTKKNYNIKYKKKKIPLVTRLCSENNAFSVYINIY